MKTIKERKENLIEAIVSLNDEDSTHFCDKWYLGNYYDWEVQEVGYTYAKNVVKGECKTIDNIKEMEDYLRDIKTK